MIGLLSSFPYRGDDSSVGRFFKISDRCVFCVEAFRVSFRGLKLIDFLEYAVFGQLEYGGDNTHLHKPIEWSMLVRDKAGTHRVESNTYEEESPRG